MKLSKTEIQKAKELGIEVGTKFKVTYNKFLTFRLNEDSELEYQTGIDREDFWKYSTMSPLLILNKFDKIVD